MTSVRNLATRLAVVVAMSLPSSFAGGAETPPLIQTLAGRYSKHLLNGMMDGERYWSDDVVEVVPLRDEAAFVRVALQFANGHGCDLSGVAKVEHDQLVYRESPLPGYSLPVPGSWEVEHPCVLRLSRVGAKLQLDDGEGSCHGWHCGMRGTLTWALPFSSRRPITYMPLIKVSRQYQDALTRWGSGH